MERAKPRIFIDADACPVKDETYRVAGRYGLHVFVVSNGSIRVPPSPAIEPVVVATGPDAADDWIALRALPHDIVITADIPLAARALKAGATALGANGKPFTADSIGLALAKREIAEHLRSFGETTGGPRAFDQKARSLFLGALDTAVNGALRAHLLTDRQPRG